MMAMLEGLRGKKSYSFKITIVVLVTIMTSFVWSTAVFAEMTCTDEGGGVISCGNNTGSGETSYAPTVTTTTTVNVDGDTITAAATSDAAGTGAAIGLYNDGTTTPAPDLTINLISFDSLTSNFDTGSVVEVYCEGGGNATITVGENAGSILSTNASGSQPKGVRARTSSGDASVTMEGGAIETSGTRGYGIRARSVGDGDSLVTMSGQSAITTSGDASHGIISTGSDTNGGGAIVTMTGGTITTGGSSSHGILSQQSGDGNSSISISGESTITTTGDDSYGAHSYISNTDNTGNTEISMAGGTIESSSSGLNAKNNGTGNVMIDIGGGSITSSTGHGAYANIGNAANTGLAGIVMAGGTIASGDSGLEIEHVGTGDIEIDISGSSSITSDTIGAYAYHANTASTGAATITMANGIINAISTGLNADNRGTGSAGIVMNGGVITVSGDDSTGIYAASYGGDTSVEMTGGSINATDSDGIQALTQEDADRSGLGASTIILSGGAVINAGSNAVYNDYGNSIVTVSGDATTITGDFDLNGGTDTLTISGGTITLSSGIFGGEGNDTFTLSGGGVTGDFYGEEDDDTFTWSGGELNSGFYGGDGSDEATVSAADYDGNQILDGGDDTSVDDGYIDELTLSGVTVSANGGNILNWEVLTLDEGTSLAITGGSIAVGDGSESTGIYVANSSTLDGGSRLTIDGSLNIDSSSQFLGIGGGVGVYTITHNLSNAGTIDTQDGVAGDTVTVGGDYSGGGTLKFDTDFSTGATDNLSVTGNVSMDNATIEINGLASTTSSTSSEIVLIDAPNDSDKSDEHFVLAESNRYDGNSNLGRWAGSPFIWKLKNSDGNCVLGDAYELPSADTGGDDPGGGSRDDRSGDAKPAVVSEIPAEVSLPTFAYEVSINKLNTLHKRLGELRKHKAWANFDPASGPAGLFPPVGFDENHLNVWARSTFAGFNIDADDNFEVEGRYGLAQVGFDYKMGDDANTIYAGFYGGYIEGNFDNSGEGGDYGSLYEAHTDMDGWSAGVYGTWMNTRGTYVDLVFDYSALEAHIEAVDSLSTDGDTISGSVEAGQSLTIIPRLIVEPQLQAKAAYITWDGFNDGYSDVSFEDHTYVTGRVGARVEYTLFRSSGLEIKPWLYLGAQHEFTDDSNITNVIEFESHQYDTTGNVQAGITWEDTGMFQFYADAGYTSDFDVYDAWRVDAGFRIRF